EDDIKRIVEAAGDIPVTINMGFGIRSRPTTPLLPLPILKKLGVRRVSLPRMLPAAAIHGMQSALEAMKVSIETGVPQDRPDLVVGIDDIMTLMGYDDMRALEKRLLSTDALEAKYGK
ncbi:MAG: isocitrate lyase/PEP mutase family protein, partial [Hyphomicrobiales bacterium]|nr:isocitrate lyase/PEP mutase family protein [Hyphomicrobiales bacterium]